MECTELMRDTEAAIDLLLKMLVVHLENTRVIDLEQACD